MIAFLIQGRADVFGLLENTRPYLPDSGNQHTQGRNVKSPIAWIPRREMACWYLGKISASRDVFPAYSRERDDPITSHDCSISHRISKVTFTNQAGPSPEQHFVRWYPVMRCLKLQRLGHPIGPLRKRWKQTVRRRLPNNYFRAGFESFF